jgi:hypothetical protein
VEPARLRTLLRTIGAAAFFVSIGFLWFFATGEAGSWRDPESWPPFVRTVGVGLAVIGISLPNLWLLMGNSGPETSTRRFAILATIFCIAVVAFLAVLAISEPTRIAGWLWLAISVAVAVVAIRGLWNQVDRTP